VNHTRFPKEDHLPDWARRDNRDTKGDRAERALSGLQNPDKNVTENITTVINSKLVSSTQS